MKHSPKSFMARFGKMACHPMTGESLLRSFRAGKENGMIYQLVDAPRLWLDVDALIWNVEQAARMERFGDDALPFWECAYTLGKRGLFLPDDCYVDWATQRRNEVEGYYRQTVHALACIYLSRYGTAGASEALLLLRTYWQQHPRDEDALRLLMHVLIQQDRYQEALEYYDQLCSVLQEDGILPDERTKDSAEYCKVKQIQYGSVAYSVSGSGKQCQQQIVSSSFTHVVQDNVEISHVLDGAFPLNTSRRAMLQNFIGWMGATALSPMVSVDVNALCSANPSEFPPVNQHSSRKISTETLDDFSQLTETCRSLSEGNELKTAERVLWSYLPQIEVLAQVQSPHQKAAAAITSQAYVLAASLVGHHNDLQSRQSCSERAIWYAECAQNVELQVAALRQLAVTFDYLALPQNVLQTYQRALPLLKDVSPRLQACIYSALSGVYAQLQQEQEAHHFMGIAYEKYPGDRQNEPGYLRTINASYHTLILWDGLNHLELGQPLKAHKILQEIPTLEPTEQIPERIRVELLNYQAKALVAVRDLEQACAYIKTAVDASTVMGSRKRFQESFAVFQQMKEVWPTEARIYDLGNLFLQRMINHVE